METLIEQITKFISENEFLSGGLTLGLLGSVFYFLKGWLLALFVLLKNRVVLNVNMYSEDSTFEWIMQWLKANKKNPRNIWFVAGRISSSNNAYMGRTKNKKVVLEDHSSMPGIGNHLIFHRKIFFIFSLGVREKELSDSLSYTMNIRALFCSQKKWEEFIRDVKSFVVSIREKQEAVGLYLWNMGYFREAMRKSARRIDSLFYPNKTQEKIIKDLDDFYHPKTRKDYEALGIPYRRSYMFEGPSGNGKTSLVIALAGLYRKNIYIVNIGSNQLDDDTFIQMMMDIKENSFVLFDEVDRVIENKDVDGGEETLTPINGQAGEETKKKKGITLSGFLSGVDGVGTAEGIVIFYSANNPEKLPVAMKRHGRMDDHFNFVGPDFETALEMARAFFPNSSPEDVSGIAQEGIDRCPSMAELQGFYLEQRKLNGVNTFNHQEDDSQNIEKEVAKI